MRNILIRNCPASRRFVESTWALALFPQPLTGPHTPLGTWALATAWAHAVTSWSLCAQTMSNPGVCDWTMWAELNEPFKPFSLLCYVGCVSPPESVPMKNQAQSALWAQRQPHKACLPCIPKAIQIRNSDIYTPVIHNGPRVGVSINR